MSDLLPFLWCHAAGWLSCIDSGGTTGALAYVGPGAGLSMLGALAAVSCVVALALLGPILYPLRAIRSMYRRRREQRAALAAGPHFERGPFPGPDPTAAEGAAARPVFGDCGERDETCSAVGTAQHTPVLR